MMIGAVTMKVRLNRAPFVLLLLAGLSWISLWTLQLPPVDRLAFLPPPEASHLRQSRTTRTPTKSLRPNNLEIVRNATPIDLEYVDVSNNHTEHPHCGARDEQGNWGYVHDETALRRNPPAFSITPERLQQDCMKRDDNHVMLTKRVNVDAKAHDSIEQSGRKRAKILCVIYSTDAAHKEKIPAIRETWG